MSFTVLIDGPSGAGKTTLANLMGRALGMEVVHLDDFYPGWGGLAEGARMVAEDVLRPRDPGYWRWDWKHDRRGEWVALDPAADLIVEGVGALTGASLSAARARGSVVAIRVIAPAEVRKRRALARDPGFAPYWDMWAAQEARLGAGADADVTVTLMRG
ncbi:(d)CMP kinase [uncultured Corynebacterium sp.]|uniref:(d)CMP kinase n=1 Tax=uncultured Corynebacterium sp. TaxID=159447 RepID=UPI0025919FA1|nr:(d)CMP kinase [uncultured Corynebacterium sp.]